MRQLLLALPVGVAGPAAAQCVLQPLTDPVEPCWVDWVEVPGAFATTLSDPEEKDLVVADFDNDGDDDVLCVRKEPFYDPGGRSHVFFRNDGGVLIDASSMLTSAGPNRPSRDVAVLDADDDGFLDFVVANTSADGFPEQPAELWINDSTVNGTFAGFTEAAGWLLPGNYPCTGISTSNDLRSCAIAVGDVDRDGNEDVWITTYGPMGVVTGADTGDRVYLGQGDGTFVDATQEVIDCALVQAGGSTSVGVGDYDRDNDLDLMRGGPVMGYEVLWNDWTPAGGASFTSASQVAPPITYAIAGTDLNGDGALDFYKTNDSCDAAEISDGNNPPVFSFNALGDFDLHHKTMEIGGNAAFGDVDGDGFIDVGVCDIDIEFESSLTDPTTVFTVLRNRTLTAGVFGGLEDRDALEQLPINITDDSVYDAAFFDLDGDGLTGVLLATGFGYRYFERKPFGENYGPLTPNSVGAGAVIGFEGRPSLSENALTLTASGVPPLASGEFFVSLGEQIPPLPFWDGNLLLAAPVQRLGGVSADAAGDVSVLLDLTSADFAGVNPCDTLHFQLWYRDPAAGGTGANLTDGLKMTMWH
ncbi:MAG: VCBS repeat-containing protein [Planctomycetota bacterium]